MELNSELLAEVRAVLGTTGIRDTIDAAFERIVRQARRQALLEQLITGSGLDLGPEHLAAARPAPMLNA